MVSIYDFIYNEFLTLVNYNYSKYYNLTSVKDTILYNFTCIYDMCMKLVYRLYDHNTIFNSNQTLTLCGKNTYQLNYKLQNYPNTLDRVNEISNIVSPYLYEFIKAVCSIIDWLIDFIYKLDHPNTQLNRVTTFNELTGLINYYTLLFNKYSKLVYDYDMAEFIMFKQLCLDKYSIFITNINSYKNTLSEIRSLYDILSIIWKFIGYVYLFIIVAANYISYTLSYVFVLTVHMLQTIIEYMLTISKYW